MDFVADLSALSTEAGATRGGGAEELCKIIIFQ